VKPFNDRVYSLWAEIAGEYVKIGEVSKAKDLTKEALRHCKVLSDI
jgi:hypothetical protein